MASTPSPKPEMLELFGGPLDGATVHRGDVRDGSIQIEIERSMQPLPDKTKLHVWAKAKVFGEANVKYAMVAGRLFYQRGQH